MSVALDALLPSASVEDRRGRRRLVDLAGWGFWPTRGFLGGFGRFQPGEKIEEFLRRGDLLWRKIQGEAPRTFAVIFRVHCASLCIAAGINCGARLGHGRLAAGLTAAGLTAASRPCRRLQAGG